MTINIKTNKLQSQAFKFEAELDNQVVGRVYLYLIYNDLHPQPYALLEDLFVKPDFRHQGIATKLIEMAISQAKQLNCYKILGTSRFTRPKVHQFYQTKFNFQRYGYAFRLDL